MGRLCRGAYEMSGIKTPIFLHGWVGSGGVVVVGWVVSGGRLVGGVIRLSFQSNSNSQKLSLWCKKISVNLMKDLKYEHQSILLCWEGSKLILGTGKENQIFILRTPAAINFFIKFSKNDTLV